MNSHSEKQDSTSDNDLPPTTTVVSDEEAHQIETQSSEWTTRSVLALVASALAYFTTVGFTNAYGTFQLYYVSRYLANYTQFQISWIGSFATFAMFAFAAPAGLLADKYGPTVPISVGSVGLVLATLMISLCTEYYQLFLSQGVLFGISASLIAIPTSTIVPQYFKRNRGLAQGISIAGSSLGGILWPVALDQLLNHDDIGFGWSLRVVGFVMIPLLVIVVIFLRKPLEPARPPQFSDSTASAAEAVQGPEKKDEKKDYTSLKHPSFIFLCAGLAFAFFGFCVPLFYITTYAVYIGTSQSLAFYLLSILNGASLAGRILPGLLADRLGHFNILALSIFSSSIIVFSWTAATSVPGLVVWAVAYGFSSGAILSLQLACATLLATPKTQGAAIGAVMASASLTGLVGAPVAGALIKSGGYIALSCFAAGALLVGGSLVLMARLARQKGWLVRV